MIVREYMWELAIGTGTAFLRIEVSARRKRYVV